MSGINIYCDESTHLENDGMPFLVLGAVKCSEQQSRDVSIAIRGIKEANGRKPYIEAKWTNIGPSNVELYLQLVDYFFDNDNLSARVVVAPKGNLDHSHFNQTYDDWYFKIYYLLLEKALQRKRKNYVYIDIKDNRSADKVRILHEYLSNRLHDFDNEIVKWVQVIRSHESELMQLADILLGGVNYANRKDGSSEAKWQVVERIRLRSRLTLLSSTSPHAAKFNLFHWQPRTGK